MSETGSRPGPECEREGGGSSPAWGYESPSLLNSEVSNILSRGQPPPEPDERHKWTHPSPGPGTKQPPSLARPVSCPLYPGPGSASAPPSTNKKFVTPSSVASVSPFQMPDQSQELRNHLYQAAYQHHSPFRFPFLPVNPVNRFFQSLPPSPLRLPYPFPYPYPPAYLPSEPGQTRESPSQTRDTRESPTSHKRKHSDDHHSHGNHHKSPSNDSKDKAREPQSIVRRSPVTTQPPETSSNSNNNSSPYFRAGSLIQLASGHMKKVEDLNTDDFVISAATCPDISIDQARVSRLDHSPDTDLYTIVFGVGRAGPGQEMVSVDVSGDHPFFVTEQGWSSCSPAATMTSYHLEAAQLVVGDICISLRHTQTEADARTKQVRFLDSPVPPSTVKKKRISPDDLTTSRPTPVSLNLKVSHLETNFSASLTPSHLTKESASQHLTTK